MDILELAKALREAPCIDTKNNIPEGTRYVQISDKLANQIAELLEIWGKDPHYWKPIHPVY